MDSKIRKIQLATKMSLHIHTLQKLFLQIKYIENDTQTPVKDKNLQIKKIREELSKVGAEIDIIKKEIKLINTYNLN